MNIRTNTCSKWSNIALATKCCFWSVSILHINISVLITVLGCEFYMSLKCVSVFLCAHLGWIQGVTVDGVAVMNSNFSNKWHVGCNFRSNFATTRPLFPGEVLKCLKARFCPYCTTSQRSQTHHNADHERMTTPSDMSRLNSYKDIREIGRWTIWLHLCMTLIGCGTYGTIFEAEQRLTHRRVVLKKIMKNKSAHRIQSEIDAGLIKWRKTQQLTSLGVRTRGIAGIPHFHESIDDGEVIVSYKNIVNSLKSPSGWYLTKLAVLIW